MSRILIVGAGQSGLQLALGLLRAGHEVTVMTARTSAEIRGGRVMSTQCMFGQALDTERRVGADLWADSGHRIDGLGVSVAGPDGARVIDWLGRFDQYAQSIDQRVKMSSWLELFEDEGGDVVVNAATVSDLDRLAPLYDLTLVAAGKGEITALFDRDPARSPYDAPQRALAIAYVNGFAPRPEHPETAAVRFNIVPGVAEFIAIPALTVTGLCDILFWEAVPGGPLDVFDRLAGDPKAVLDTILHGLRTYLPWEYERCAQVELTDAGGTLAGRYAPTVRHAVAELPSGGLVLGMADVIVANDPITGQGSNNAARCADTYLQAILEHGDRPFDRGFMQAAADAYWNRVAVCTAWTNAMLAPPPPHVLEILGAAGQFQPVADRFANGFADPDDFANWLVDPGLTAAYLGEVAAQAQAQGGTESVA
ncbi:MAG TPA: styrene monooxygenase/indole monooxygenase family protein [Actinospica sp.]|jgi:NAD(P)-dependent dehydrogenase (short-subunit alcohol dehydrogenase family)|nr:styrene monooxygenase/indole monooxygenase family protein [Actinospica sp.]